MGNKYPFVEDTLGKNIFQCTRRAVLDVAELIERLALGADQ
ncbi:MULTISPECIES: hypothetical protein [unclassified Mesorhizobium]|nr:MULTISPECIES: hypothetical protein [unclassified Mesorhizobium]